MIAKSLSRCFIVVVLLGCSISAFCQSQDDTRLPVFHYPGEPEGGGLRRGDRGFQGRSLNERKKNHKVERIIVEREKKGDILRLNVVDKNVHPFTTISSMLRMSSAEQSAMILFGYKEKDVPCYYAGIEDRRWTMGQMVPSGKLLKQGKAKTPALLSKKLEEAAPPEVGIDYRVKIVLREDMARLYVFSIDGKLELSNAMQIRKDLNKGRVASAVTGEKGQFAFVDKLVLKRSVRGVGNDSREPHVSRDRQKSLPLESPPKDPVRVDSRRSHE